MKTCYYVGVLDPINKKKPIGMINGLKSFGYDVEVYPEQKKLILNKNYDLFFGEYLNLDKTFNWNAFKTVVCWTNLNLLNALDCAKEFPNTKFVISPKSYLHSNYLNNWHFKNFGEIYSPMFFYENQNLTLLNNLLIDSNQVNNHCFRLLDNLFYCYLPCCLSEDISIDSEKSIDITYIGTTHNRPYVQQAINYFKQKYNIFSSFDGGSTTPEETIKIYSQSKIVLTEQISPVILEYPVRLGEATRQGCQVVAYTPIEIPQNLELIPDHSQATSFDSFLNIIETKINNFQKKIYTQNTYTNALNFLFNSIS